MADEQGIEIPGLPEGHPPLMIFVDKPIMPKDYEYIRDIVSEAIRNRGIVIFEPGIDVYQMIDGRWQPLRTDG